MRQTRHLMEWYGSCGGPMGLINVNRLSNILKRYEEGYYIEKGRSFLSGSDQDLLSFYKFRKIDANI